MAAEEKNKKVDEIVIYRKVCKACGICVAFCPTKTLELDENGYPYVKNLNDCIGCDLCSARCPDLAIVVVHSKEKETVKKGGDK